jgi:uncharacterized damage-inducible protein DinB
MVFRSGPYCQIPSTHEGLLVGREVANIHGDGPGGRGVIQEDHVSERETLKAQLLGVYSHVHMLDALEGLSAEQAGAVPEGLPHSVFQLLRHMIYWQDIGIERMRGTPPPFPESAAEGWTALPAPAGQTEWDDTIESFTAGLWEIDAMLDSPEVDLDAVVESDRWRTVRDNLLMIMCHNSYHLGEIVMLRRQLGAWPPPQGGDTF